MVTGCTQLSNCAARIRYMKMIDSRKASMKLVNARPCSRERPVKPDAYSVGRFIFFVSATSASMTVCAECHGAMFAVSITCRCLEIRLIDDDPQPPLIDTT